jgi:uncharacterized RDD family membrane protein YckC
MYCSSCGTKNEDHANYCVKCGLPKAGPAQSGGYSSNDYAYAGPTVRYAGFWKRVVASVLDGIIVGIPMGIVSYLLFGDDENAMNLFSFLIGVLYKTLMESSSTQATVGKMIMGIRVTDVHGGRISFGRAVGRYFAQFISSIILGIGYLMAGWTAKKQALHDMIAGTYVVNK